MAGKRSYHAMKKGTSKKTDSLEELDEINVEKNKSSKTRDQLQEENQELQKQLDLCRERILDLLTETTLLEEKNELLNSELKKTEEELKSVKALGIFHENGINQLLPIISQLGKENKSLKEEIARHAETALQDSIMEALSYLSEDEKTTSVEEEKEASTSVEEAKADLLKAAVQSHTV